MVTMVLFRARNINRPNTDNNISGLLMTRTCMKIGIIDTTWEPRPGLNVPKPGEWWMVYITGETKPGINRGCLILSPIERVTSSINPLITGLYTEYTPNPGTLIISPKFDTNGQWYIPLLTKQNIAFAGGYASVVVNLGGEYWI